jgi:hypothetical protein
MLMIDLSNDATLDALQTKVLTFLKNNVVQSGTVIYDIKAGKGGSTTEHRHYLDPAQTLEAHASMIADELAVFAKSSIGRLYRSVTLEIW